MKFSTSLLLLAGLTALNEVYGKNTAERKLQTVDMVALPTQTFFLPAPEDKLLPDLFKIIHSGSSSTVVTLFSITISTDHTIVWYDEWEDGYDENVAFGVGKSTKVWGDGNAANGCAPTIANCTNSMDILKAGDSFVVQNDVPIPRIKGNILYDGGDRIQASMPINVNRAAYAQSPGSVLAGAIEVLDTLEWGKTFEAPVGVDLGVTNFAFEHSIFMIMAGYDNTKVLLPDNTTRVLNIGQSTTFRVNQGHRITSDKPTQCHLFTGDINSAYETRWYSMRPIETYADSYVTPVGDSMGKTKMIIYNPSTLSLNYTFKYLVNETERTATGIVAGKQAGWTLVIPTDSGASIDGSHPFVALTVTDSENTAGDDFDTGGQWYDWGCPVVPRRELTSQVLLGLGYGCTNNDCGSDVARSVVWITPVDDADIYIDYQNKGFNVAMIPAVKKLQSIRVSDPIDKDMSGASIFAVQSGTGVEGPSVDIAVAWGQDPSVSRPNQAISMDMGTVTLPFTNLKVAKIVDKVFIREGDELTYTIRVANVGQKHVSENDLTVFDSLDADVTYIPGSTEIKYMFGSFDKIAVADSPTGTAFPLDERGLSIPSQIPRRGKYVDITFKVKTAAKLSVNKSKIVNNGYLTQRGGLNLPFEATSFLFVDAAIKVDNTVLLGMGGSQCGSGQEVVTGRFGANVTYCFKVTNIGLSPLIGIKLSNAEINFSASLNKTLAPGESVTTFTSGRMSFEGLNNVVATANPAFPNGVEISDTAAVTSQDTSETKLIAFFPKISIDNKVYIGNNRGSQCRTSNARETVSDIFNTNVTYCHLIKNTGNTRLGSIRIVNAALGVTWVFGTSLAPNGTTLAYVDLKIRQDLINNAEVVAVPVLDDNTRIFGAPTVQSQDPSAVVKLTFLPSILIENTVYIGKDGGNKCGTIDAVEFVSDYYATSVTYCFKITNTGETSLKDVVVTNANLQYNKTAGTIASGASVFQYYEGTITDTFQNIANVTGTPVMADGRALGDLKKVSHSDPSQIGLKDNTPSVAIENTVVLGHEGGCGTSAAKESVEGYPGTKVTYCFNIKNTGDSHLDSITLTNNKLAYSSVVPMLAPGISTMVTLQSTITVSLENLVNVTANPTLASGLDIPRQADVSASDPSSVDILEYKPVVLVNNTVYLGSSASKSCLTSVESIEGKFGDDVTYCFLVTNAGNTHLKDFKIDNDELGFKDISSIKFLAPGASELVFVGGQITKSFENVVTVTATPTKESGESLAIPDVKNSDPSTVARIPHKANVKIDNKVYVGTVDDKSCGTDKAMEIVRDIYFTDVVYCLNITNTGETYLGSIVIEDKELEYNVTLSFTLAPGAFQLLAVPGKIVSDLKNNAAVKANPILSDGRDIEGAPDVSSSDDSAVNKLVYIPSVRVENTVYKGIDGGNACHTSSESVKDLFGTDVTYCFTVTNTGTTSLTKVVLSNEVLFYATSLNSPMKPGDSVLLTFPSRISNAVNNIINVTGTPIMMDGRALLDLQPVKHSDPSGVELLPHSPNLTISNTVYLGGTDNGSKCSTGVEIVEDKYGAAVTYCFTIKNSGDTYLQGVTLFDTEIALNSTALGVLAPDESITFPFVSTIKGDVTNIAVATGTPSLKDGGSIPGTPDVVATDPSSVKQVAHQPTINIENTVYIGTDAGVACADSKLDVVSGYPKTDVVYCLQVINTGDSYLTNVVVVDAELNINDSSITLLAPGASKIIPVSGFITGNVTNTAKVTALPALADGNIIPSATAVSDFDTSMVEQLAYSPSIKIDNVIGLGHKSDSCVNARDLVDGFMGDEITYCFTVTNMGDTILSNISIKDEDINYSVDIKDVLAPKDFVTVSFPSNIAGDFVNVAEVTATPVNKDLSPIIDLGKVVSEDDSGTNKFDLVGGIKIDNKVYDSSIPGSSCASGADIIDGKYGTPSTYCFTVTNTGETHLNNVVVENTALEYNSGPIKMLSPGESVVLSFSTKIKSTLENTAVATGNPVTETGKDIADLNDVTHSDSSKVIMLESNAAVTVLNTVYRGVDNGKLCGTSAAVEMVQGYFHTQVTYCFEVKNIGDTYLTQVSIENKELDILDNSIKKLTPGETVMISVTGKIATSLVNNAVVSGVASVIDGSVIPGMAPVTASDKSAVERLEYIANIDIINTVYLGGSTNNNGVSSCSTAQDHVDHYEGSVITYCFKVINKGDSHLNNVVIENKDLNFTDKLVNPLAPGESITVVFPSTISSSMKNTAVVTGNPVLDDGIDIPDMKEVTWSDSSSVGELVYFPKITIDNRVYIGDDNGEACETSVESVSGKANTSVIYCFNITNTGDTYLSNIAFKNIELMYNDNSMAMMAPKESKLLVFVSKISANMTNHAVVTANPTLADGADISGAVDVTATDPSDVVLKIGIDSEVRQGETLLPPTNSTKCIQDNWKAANNTDDLVCASKEVYVDSVTSAKPLTCSVGETIKITVDANIQIAGPRNDVGWYIASDGGDALTGKCIVNGFQNNGAKYELLDAKSQSAGFIQWTKADGADGDQCGDVFIVNDGSAKVTTPIMVNAALPCTDDNDDGALDFAICFTWKTDATNKMCHFSTNIPGTNCGCFCTRIDVPNVEVVPTPVDPISAC